ncbi:MAG: low affinity iron permease family protein [Pirellulales bacterium]
MKLFHHWFTVFAKWTAWLSGQPLAFILASLLIVIWAVTGPLFGFSDTWQLVINTGTTIVTFLMVFLIQNTQNRDTGAIQTKLDELIRALEGAHNALLDLEELDEGEIEHIRRDYRNLAAKAREAITKGQKDTSCDEVDDCDDENKDDAAEGPTSAQRVSANNRRRKAKPASLRRKRMSQ